MRKHIEVFAVNLVIPLNICCHHCCVLCYICYSIPGSFVPLTMSLLKNNVLSLKANANMADLQAEEVDMGMKMLMVSVPGIPGEDYPILQQVKLFPFFLGRIFPAESFSCCSSSEATLLRKTTFSGAGGVWLLLWWQNSWRWSDIRDTFWKCTQLNFKYFWSQIVMQLIQLHGIKAIIPSYHKTSKWIDLKNPCVKADQLF